MARVQFRTLVVQEEVIMRIADFGFAFPASDWLMGMIQTLKEGREVTYGYLGIRGTFDEGTPVFQKGTLVNGFHETWPIVYPEPAHGYASTGQTIVNTPDGTLIRLYVDDEPFDMRYGTLRSHERVLSLRSGTLRRDVEWYSPAGQGVRIVSRRLVSFTQRAIAAICYEVTPLEDAARLILQSELVANEDLPDVGGDPRAAAALRDPLVADEDLATDTEALLIHHTRASDLRLAAGMFHVVNGPEHVEVHTQCMPDWARTTVACVLDPGETLQVVKFIGYGWSGQRSRPALRLTVFATTLAAWTSHRRRAIAASVSRRWMSTTCFSNASICACAGIVASRTRLSSSMVA